MKIQNKFIVIIVMISVSVAFYGLTKNNAVIPDSLYPCCDNGICVAVKCDATSGMMIKPDCVVLNTTCRLCVDYTVSNCLCTSGSDRCLEEDDSYYYGQYVNCPPPSKQQ